MSTFRLVHVIIPSPPPSELLEDVVVEFHGGRRQNIAKSDLSYASWFIACRQPKNTLVPLLIKADVIVRVQ